MLPIHVRRSPAINLFLTVYKTKPTSSIMKATVLALALATLGFSLTASAQQMNYQGRLTDSSGNPNTNLQEALLFSVWDAPTGGSQVWGPFQKTVDLIDGRFSVKLGTTTGDDGNGNLLAQSFAGPRYLQLQVNGAASPLPRQEVLASPKALSADLAVHANTATNATNATNAATAQSLGSIVTVGSSSNAGVNQQWSNVSLNVRATSEHEWIFNAERSDGSDTLQVKTDHNVGVNNIHDNVALNVRAVPTHEWIFNAEHSDGTNTFEVKKDRNVGVNQSYNNVALNVRSFPNHTSSFVVENNGGTRLFRVAPEGGIDLYSSDYFGSNSEGDPYQRFIKLNAKSQDGLHTTTWNVAVDSNDLPDEDLIFVQDGHLRGWLDGGSGAGGDGWVGPSDRRLKKEITSLNEPLASALALRPRTYQWKGQRSDEPKAIGFIAQEVAEVLPNAVNETGGTLGLSYGVFGVVAIGAIQELKAEKDREMGAMQSEVSNLRKENATLKESLAVMQKQMASLGQAVATLQAASTTPVAQN